MVLFQKLLLTRNFLSDIRSIQNLRLCNWFMASRIIHCDLDAFYAAVETLHHNLDTEIPLILGSDTKMVQGVELFLPVITLKSTVLGQQCQLASMEEMPRNPHGIGNYMKSTRGLYSRASRKVMKILAEHADIFEQASIDEAYLDVTERCGNDWDKALGIAKDLQSTIHNKLGLSTSFGIGSTRILAKMGSEENKPAGIHRTLPDGPLFFLTRGQ